jgi:BMFP domain-containing protein YqiC
MSEILDKARLIGSGLEKTIVELVEELEAKGKERCSEKEGQEGAEKDSSKSDLPPSEKFENRVVADGVKAIKELLSILREGKSKIEGEVSDAADTVAEKLNLATKSELEVVKEMARVAREKVDKLEKKIAKMTEDKA